MRRVFVALFFIFCATGVFSQNITGTVLDTSNRKPIPGASVFLKEIISGKTLHIAGTDSSGQFKIETSEGDYTLRFESEGYEYLEIRVSVKTSGLILNPVSLKNLAIDVGTSEIVVETPIKQKADTTEYNASSFKVNPDATAEDLVKKMPGISSENGKIMAQGEEVKKVTLDGKDFFGDDAQSALKNLPAELVDKIQVFDRMSDQAQFTGFDDGNSVKSINIKTKSGKANGTFGKAYGGYGTDQRYQTGLVYNRFKGDRRFTLLGMSNNINQQNFTSQDLLGLNSGSSGGRGRGGPGGYYSMPATANFLVDQSGGISSTHSGGLNYNDKWGKKWTVSGSYFFNKSANTNEQTILRTYPSGLNSETGQTYLQESTIKNSQTNHRLQMRIEYAMDSNNSILFTPSVSFQRSNSGQNLNAQTVSSAAMLSSTGSEYDASGAGFNINNSILYRHRFTKERRTFSAQVQHQHNPSLSESYNRSNNQTYVPVDTVFITDQLTENNSGQQNYQGRITYTEPLGKASMLQFDYRYSSELNETDKTARNAPANSTEYTETDTVLSNRFSTNYTTHQPGIMLRIRTEKLRLSAGTGYQYATLKGQQIFPMVYPVDKSFANFLPRIFGFYQFSKSSQLRFTLRSSTRIPGISQFQNVINISNPLLLTTGNPELKQSVSQDLTLRYNSSNIARQTSFFAGAYFTVTGDYITNATQILTKDSQISDGFTAVRGAQISAPVNLSGYNSSRVLGYYSFVLKKIKSNVNINGSYSYTRLPGMVNDIRNISGTHNVSGGLALNSNVSESLDFSLSAMSNFYEARNSTQLSLNNQYFNHTANAKINYIFWKRLVISSDIIYNRYSGLNSGFNQEFALWNGAVAYKFAKNNAAEIRISCYDILKQNRSISRSITETYVEDSRTTVLTRYLMATFTWNFRNFANGGKEPEAGPERSYMGPPGSAPHGVPGGHPPGGKPPGNEPGIEP